MFLHVSVILSTGGGVWQTHPLGRQPPQADTPIKTPPWADTPCADTPCADTHPRQTPPPQERPLQWTVSMLLECILVITIEGAWAFIRALEYAHEDIN